jgi:hypothetical protein
MARDTYQVMARERRFGSLRQLGKVAPSLPSAAFARGPTAGARGLWLIALAIGLTAGSFPVAAEEAQQSRIIHLSGAGPNLDDDLAVVCPDRSPSTPQFQNRRTGRVFPITDPRLRAIAQKACEPDLDAAPTSDVSIVNDTGATIYVGFAPQAGSGITWGEGCGKTATHSTAVVGKGATCAASVINSNANPGSRFCAARSLDSTGILNCWQAQTHLPHNTIIEPNFLLDCKFGDKTYPGCVFYDVSVIPANCTDNLFTAANDYCKGTGGASYNLPVKVSCPDEPTFTCKGPVATSGVYAATGYPSMCGTPSASCIGNTQSCVNGYFSPTNNNPQHQPGAYCFGTLTMTFLAGP